jgi:hypothetical protein
MLDIVALLIFSGVAYRTFMTVRRESSILSEFGLSTTLAYTALLFPLGPVVLLLAAARVPIVGVALCAACYIPSLVLARKITATFDRAGTDRVKVASSAAWVALGTAIAGLVYAGVALALLMGLDLLRGPTDA